MAAIVVVTFLFLSPTLRGAYIWDDDDWLTHNRTVMDPGGLPLIWGRPAATPHYYPLVFTTFWVEYQLYGLGETDATGLQRGVLYHVDNLLMHIGSAVLIYLILKKLKLPGGELGAWLAAVVWAIHPVNVESVAWVAERKNTLCGVFFFWSLLYALDFFGVTEEPGEKKRWGKYVLSLVLFVGALLSKTITAPLAPAILLMIWWRRGKITRREILLSIPFWVLALGLSINSIVIEHDRVGATGPEFAFTFWQKFLIAANSLGFYAGKVFVPYPVVQLYPRFGIDAIKGITDASVYVAPVCVFAVLGVLGWWAKRGGGNRGPLTAMLFFAGVLFPALGFIVYYTMIYTFVADHYQYLACVSLIVLGVEGILYGLRVIAVRLRPDKTMTAEETQKRFLRLTSGLMAAGLIATLGTLTYGIANLYADPIDLWSFNIMHSPNSYAAWAMRGQAYINERPSNPEAGLADLKHSLALAPENWKAYEVLGDAYLNWGMTQQAMPYLEKAEALMPAFVREGRVHYYEREAVKAEGGNDAEARRKKLAGFERGADFAAGEKAEAAGNVAGAIAAYRADLKNYPKNPETYYRLGNCYFGQNDFADAAAAYRAATELYGDFAEAWFNLSLTLGQLGRTDESYQAFQKAYEIDPGVVLGNKALTGQMERQLRGK